MQLAEMLSMLQNIYENQMPFNRLLGISIPNLTATDIKVKIDMRQDLVGNFFRNILHGGVISSLLDLTGGIIASVELLKGLENKSIEEVKRELTRLSTMDLRVDYLRGGSGDFFYATGSVLRRGRKVVVIRTELHRDDDTLIAAGTGTYLLG